MDIIGATRLSMILLDGVLIDVVELRDLAAVCRSYLTNHSMKFEELVNARIWTKSLSTTDIKYLVASQEDFVTEYLSLLSSTFCYKADHIPSMEDYCYMFQTRSTANFLYDVGLCERFCCIYSMNKCNCGSPLIRREFKTCT